MFSITDLKTGTKFIMDGDPYVVLTYNQSKMGRGGSVVKTKVKNLKTGNVLSKTFQGAEKLEPADMERRKATFLYSDASDSFFMDASTFEQFSISSVQLGDQRNFLREGAEVDIVYFQNEAVNIDLPVKLSFSVTQAPPGVKGNSTSTVTKKVTIETGAQVDTPLFIKEGDKIVVDTRDGSYVERG